MTQLDTATPPASNAAKGFGWELLYWAIPLSLWREAPSEAQQRKESMASDELPGGGNFALEYEQLSEGFRHVYATAWTAGAALFITSGAIAALATNTQDHRALAIAFVPYMFWFWGIFYWMDRVAKHRALRLARLEQDSGMNFYRAYESYRRDRVKTALHFFAVISVVAAVLISIFGDVIFEGARTCIELRGSGAGSVAEVCP